MNFNFITDHLKRFKKPEAAPQPEKVSEPAVNIVPTEVMADQILAKIAADQKVKGKTWIFTLHSTHKHRSKFHLPVKDMGALCEKGAPLHTACGKVVEIQRNPIQASLAYGSTKDKLYCKNCRRVETAESRA